MFNYLHRTDFFRGLRFDLVGPPRKKTPGFREASHFQTDIERRKVAAGLSDALDETVITDRLAQQSLALALDELTDNVLFHAETDLGGYAAAAALRHSHEVEVAIADLGIGIAASLSKNPDYAKHATNDMTAIETALIPTVSATPERNAGWGLAFTQFLMGFNEGRLAVRSGYGHIQHGDRVIAKTDVHPLPGTLVALRLRTDRPFDFNRAYEALDRAIRDLGKTVRIHDDNIGPVDPAR
jgi:anti-sigma regulatory factor (Ser/Thr protein kinase)